MPASANEHDDASMGEGGATTSTEDVAADDFEDDIDLLNYARLLELLEAEFYRERFNNISERESVRSNTICTFGDPIQDRLYSDF